MCPLAVLSHLRPRFAYGTSSVLVAVRGAKTGASPSRRSPLARGIFSVTKGEMEVKKGKYIKVSSIAGACPHCGQEGTSLCTLMHHGAVSLNVPEKQKKGAGALHWAVGVLPTCQNRVGGRLGYARAPPAGVCPYPSTVGPKRAGVYPPLTISLF